MYLNCSRYIWWHNLLHTSPYFHLKIWNAGSISNAFVAFNFDHLWTLVALKCNYVRFCSCARSLFSSVPRVSFAICRLVLTGLNKALSRSFVSIFPLEWWVDVALSIECLAAIELNWLLYRNYNRDPTRLLPQTPSFWYAQLWLHETRDWSAVCLRRCC